MKTYTFATIERIYDLQKNPDTNQQAFQEDLTLFSLIETMHWLTYEKYVFGDEAHLTENMTNNQINNFVREITLDAVYNKLSRN